MKTYFLDARTARSPYPLVLPLEKVLKTVPREQHAYMIELGRFRTRRQMRQALKRFRAIA